MACRGSGVRVPSGPPREKAPASAGAFVVPGWCGYPGAGLRGKNVWMARACHARPAHPVLIQRPSCFGGACRTRRGGVRNGCVRSARCCKGFGLGEVPVALPPRLHREPRGGSVDADHAGAGSPAVARLSREPTPTFSAMTLSAREGLEHGRDASRGDGHLPSETASQATDARSSPRTADGWCPPQLTQGTDPARIGCSESVYTDEVGAGAAEEAPDAGASVGDVGGAEGSAGAG